MSAAPTLRERVVESLDDLEVTDTVFHDLKHAAPLVAEVVSRVPQDARRVLVIGPNVAVAHVLADRGADVRVWHVDGVAMVADLVGAVERRGGVDDLLAASDQPAGEAFDAVVAPYLVELASAEPADTLAHLRRLVRPGGTIVVVADRAGALGTRLDAARGRSLTGRRRHPGSAGTWTWPAGPMRRTVDESLLETWAREAGLRVAEVAPVIDRGAVESVAAVRLGPWLAAHARHRLKTRVPALRDTAVASLVPITAGRADHRLGSSPQGFPRVTVVVAASDPGRLDAVLAGLENQTYPRDRTDVVLLWPASAGPVPPVNGTLARQEIVVGGAVPSAEAAGEALAVASGDVVAWTSDTCDVPPGWVESGVRELGGYAMAVAGRVLVQDGSAAAFLDLPGRRRYPRPDGLFSWTNSFYVRDALVEVGGFTDPDPDRDPTGRPTWGWDTTAAIELARRGYHVTQSNQVYLHRNHPHPPDRTWIRDEYEDARGIPLGVAHDPALAVALHRGRFATGRTMAFDLLVAGALASAITRRRLPVIVGTAAYARAISEYVDVWPPDEWSTSARHVRGVVLRNAVWLAGLVRGSVEARRVVL